VEASERRPGDARDGATAPAMEADPTWVRLEDQIAWYDRASQRKQRWYKRLKLLELMVAASLPVAAGLQLAPLAIGVLAATVVVLEGSEHLFQLHEQWISYRSTCEALRRERYLYLSRAGQYAMAPDAHKLLAERVEDLLGRENARWLSGAETSYRNAGRPGTGSASITVNR
jgi:hypothetical protein